MLQRVVRRVTEIGLRIDQQPGSALRRQHVLGMQVGAEQRRTVRGRRESPEKGYSLASDTRIQPELPTVDLLFEFIRPLIAHRLERSKPVPRWRIPPQ